MKSSDCDRESVALLACSALSSAQAARVRQHIEWCSACREYLAQMSALCETHKTASGQLRCVEAPPRLYRRVMARIQSGPAASRGSWLVARGIRWVPAIGLTVILALLFARMTFFQPPSRLPPIAVQPPSTVPLPAPKVESAMEGSKLISYRLALNRSTEEFDRLLAHDAALPSQTSATAFRAVRVVPDLGID